ncbi:uncharacterized protein AB9X84_007228 isoform 1-T1 [Acanthopagrus schlegelii]
MARDELIPEVFGCLSIPVLLGCTTWSVYLRLTQMLKMGGAPPGKDLSEVAEVVQRILEEDNPWISGLDGSQDPAAMKLELLSKGCIRRVSCVPGHLRQALPCAFDAVQPGPSTSCRGE